MPCLLTSGIAPLATESGEAGIERCTFRFEPRRRPIIQASVNTLDLTLYGGHDPRDQPRYSFPEAARATAIPASTLRAWTVGQSYRRKEDVGFFVPVLRRPDAHDSRLSFLNLIEAHIIRALRTVHDVRLSTIREAIALAEKDLAIPRLLLDPRLKTSAKQLFLDRYTDILELSRSQQLAIRCILEQYLERVEYDDSMLPFEFFPFEKVPHNAGQKVILITPFVSFGRPIIRRVGVSTRAVVQRLDAGEAVATVLRDYDLTEAELEEAVLFEAAA